MNREYRKIKVNHGAFSVDPMPGEDELAAFYRDDYYQKTPTATFSQTYSKDELSWKRMKCDFVIYILARHGLSEGRFIDVGSGEGFLVDAAVRAGFDAYGVDYSNFAVERFNPHLSRNIKCGNVIDTLKASIAAGEYFSACTLQHIVEHVRDPHELLSVAHDSLEAGGLAVVTVPNDESPVQHLALDGGHVDSDFWFAPPQHLHYFNTLSAPLLAQAVGFEVLDIITDFPIDYFLFHPGSNYVSNPSQGKAAHQARVAIELMLSRQGFENLYCLGAAQARCGLGRELTMVLRKVVP